MTPRQLERVLAAARSLGWLPPDEVAERMDEEYAAGYHMGLVEGGRA